MGLFGFLNKTTDDNNKVEKTTINAQSESNAADMEVIKNVWPWGTKEFKLLVFKKEDKDNASVIIKYAQLQPNGKGDYTLSIRAFKNKDEYKYTFIVKNEKIFLKDETGGVEVLNSLSFESDEFIYIFNPDDARYKQIMSNIENLDNIKKLRLYRVRDFANYLEGKMDKETLETIADNFEFRFTNNMLDSKEYNMASLFKEAFFRLSAELDAPLSLREETYEYINNYGVDYAWDEESFQEQWQQFRHVVNIESDKMSDMNYSSWNCDIYWEGGMVYTSIRKLLGKSYLPYELIGISREDDGLTYVLRVSDAIFDYNYSMLPDTRPLWARVTGAGDSLQKAKEDLLKKSMGYLKELIHIQLDNLLVTLKISSEKNISFRVFDDLYSGFLDDAVTDNTTDNKISEQANNNDKQFDQKSDVELDFDSEALELLKKGMKLNAVKRCSDVYGINLAEAMKKVDEFVNNHSELLN